MVEKVFNLIGEKRGVLMGVWKNGLVGRVGWLGGWSG